VLSGLVLVSLLLIPQAFAATVQQSQRSGALLTARFQYLLSNFSGPVPSQWARLAFDPLRQEIYTLNQGVNDVRIYNQQGMELFTFGDNGDIVSAVDIAVNDVGDIFVLARDFRSYAIQVLNYRGEPVSMIKIKDAPETISAFSPDRMEYRHGHFYLLDSDLSRIVVLTADGRFKQSHDLAAKLNELANELEEEQRDRSLGLNISGFAVGPDKNIYLTVPTLFSAFRLVPDGSLESFGVSGSGPGKFGVVSGITADDQGNIYVADRLRSVVMIFDRNFVFQGEFGYRGDRQGDMIVPDDLLLDQAGSRVFVSQAANKGVGVYKVVLQASP